MTRHCAPWAMMALLVASCSAPESTGDGAAGGGDVATATRAGGGPSGSGSDPTGADGARGLAPDATSDRTEPTVDVPARSDTAGRPPVDDPGPAPARRPIADSTVPASPWVVAIGDVHGDIEALRSALRLANLIDEADAWIGGQAVLVQVGDQLDRGDDERAILHLLEDLSDQAWAAGGAIYTLLGNHEVMNVELDLRYVTEGGWADFGDVPWDASDPLYADYAEHERGRVAAFRPGGPYAMLLSRHNSVMQVGDTVFVHGGLLPGLAAQGLEAINEATRAWMRGEGPVPSWFHTDDDPYWSRHYSDAPTLDDCVMLQETLELLDAQRMVVAHTVQDFGITAACQGRVWRVDVGLASYYGGPTEVLAIQGDQVGVID